MIYMKKGDIQFIDIYKAYQSFVLQPIEKSMENIVLYQSSN